MRATGSNKNPSTLATQKDNVVSAVRAGTDATTKTIKDHRVATAAIVGTALAAGFAAYYFSGTKGKARRKKVAEWTDSARMEVADRVERMGTVTRDAYYDIVDSVATAYEGKGKKKGEVSAFRKNLNAFWDEYSDVIDEAKITGKDMLVMLAERVRDADSPAQAKKDIQKSLTKTSKDALRGAARSTSESTQEDSK